MMTMEDKQLQSKQQKINVVKKKMKKIRNRNKLQTYVDIKEKPECIAENKPINTIWSSIRDKFW
jgi:hypothetical protein